MVSHEFKEGISRAKKIFEKIKWQYIVLAIIIILAIVLRSYHINYPTIGYHNMKEDEFLSFAVNMHDSGDYFKTTWFSCSVAKYAGDPYNECNFNDGETLITVWGLLIFFAIFGWKLWVARLFIILFSVATIIIIYLLVKKLADKEYLALLSSFFYAILPLSIFFGRNIQMDAPSLFLGLCAAYFFIKWIEERRLKIFIIACVFIVLAAWFKIISLIPIMFTLILLLPYKDLFDKKFLHKYWRECIALVITIVLSTMWVFFLSSILMPNLAGNSIGSGGFIGKGTGVFIDTSFSILTSNYWGTYGFLIKSYVSDNYSILGLWFILVGFLLFLVRYKSKISRFMIGYSIGIIVYLILFAQKLNAHNYYQFPFLAFAAICMANVIFQLGTLIKNMSGIKWLQFVPLLLILVLIGPFTQSTMQQFNTQFFGQDIQGEYIKSHTTDKEIFLLERGVQGQLSWAARRFYYEVPDNASLIKEIEEKKNLRYIALNGYGISSIQQKPSWEYIQNNYKIVQAGFIQTGQGPQLYTLILEKGGVFNMSSLNNRQAKLAKTYELYKQEVPFYVIE